MSYSSTERSHHGVVRLRIAVAAVSGATAIAAFSATGWLAGAAARTTDAQQAAQPGPAQQAAGQAATGAAATRIDRHRPVIRKQRPQRTHVTVRYVRATPSAPVGGGGTVSQPAVHAPSAPAPHPAPQPAPAPQPPPAPSSGS